MSASFVVKPSGEVSKMFCWSSIAAALSSARSSSAVRPPAVGWLWQAASASKKARGAKAIFISRRCYPESRAKKKGRAPNRRAALSRNELARAYFAALVAVEAAFDAEAAAESAALVAAAAALLAAAEALAIDAFMSLSAAFIALVSLETTLFAAVVLLQAASPRAETAIRVRAIFFTDFFLRMVASGCEENPLFAG